MICIHNSKHQLNALHTIINKKEVGGWVYIVAIGYGGGGVFEEFCGKFKFCDQEEQYVGTFSRFHDPDEWECEVNEDEIINEPWSEIEKADKLIIHSMSETIWNDFIYYDEDQEIRLINDNTIEIDLGLNSTNDIEEGEFDFDDSIDLDENLFSNDTAKNIWFTKERLLTIKKIHNKTL